MHTRSCLRSAVALVLALPAAWAAAPSFPNKPATLVVPLAAGGTVGSGTVASAAPDGCTVLFGAVATHAIAAGLYPKLPHDPITDFSPITQPTFEERVTTDFSPSDFGWTAGWTQRRQPYAPSRMSLRSIVEARLCERNLQIDHDEEPAWRAEPWLYDRARSDHTRPFLLWARLRPAHNPFITTQPYCEQRLHQQVPHHPLDPAADLGVTPDQA
jgi:hypothetical protein